MNTISLDAPFVTAKSRHRVETATIDEQQELPPEIDQRDLEDLQIVARWYETASIEKEAIDDVFSNYGELKSALSTLGSNVWIS